MKKQIILLVSCFIGLNACSPTQQATNHTEASTMTKTNQCVNLHRVTDIDDLLKQMHDNINSQCLFEMPTSELERIWGIRIFDFTEFDSQNVNQLSEQSPEQYKVFNNKFNKLIDIVNQHHTQHTAIYLKKYTNGNFEPNEKNNPNIIRFEIYTTSAYQKLHSKYTWFAGSVDLGQFPKHLPPPDKKIEPFSSPEHPLPPRHIGIGNNNPPPIIPAHSVYGTDSKYFWINQQKSPSLPALVIQSFVSLPEKISFFNFYQEPEEF